MRLPRTATQYQIVLDNLESFPKNCKVLEIGAGDKKIRSFLPKDIEYETLGLDESNNYNFDLNKGVFPIKDNKYGVIICMETLEHVMFPHEVIKEILRVARPNARFFFSMPNEYNFYQRLCYLFGIKTGMDLTFLTVSHNLHIHKPRIKDIKDFFSKSFSIKKEFYYWHSKHELIFIDKILNKLANIFPTLFARGVSLYCARGKK